MIMADNPDPNEVTLDVIQKMIGKTIKTASPQATGIKMKESWIDAYLFDSDLELGVKILSELGRNRIISL